MATGTPRGPLPDPALTESLAQLPTVELRGPDNPTLDPAVLDAFWDSATVRAATPLTGGPPPAEAGPPPELVPSSAPADPSRPFQDALLVRTPIGPSRGPELATAAPGQPADGTPVPAVATAPEFAPAAAAPQLVAATATGRLFFTMNGQPRSCTATVVTGASGSVVATAGHCLVAADPGPSGRAAATNFLFGPGFRAGQFPAGRWQVESVHIAAGWRARDWSQDIAFLRLAKDPSGRTVQAVTGALGLVITDQPLAGVVMLGYPAVGGFDGTVLRWCSAPTPGPRDPADLTGIAVPCAMTAGYSGGPVLAGYSLNAGTGYLTGIASHDYGAGTVYGARLGAAALAAYLEADRR